MRFVVGAILLLIILASAHSSLRAAEPDYFAADPELKVVRLDSDPKASFLGMQLDSTGRLFVGGREALFVYEPAPNGLYQPRREIFRFPDHTWVYDIAIRGDDLYVLTVSALYRLPGAVRARSGLKAERLLWGIPFGHVHQCFHGLAIGPEGDLYVQHGDPLWYYGDFNRADHWGHWTWFTADGRKTPFTGVGGVLRLKPDGSGLQIFSRGQRNSCGLAFDAQWNLFSNDNDHEGMPAEYVPGRLLHLTPNAYFSWPRGWLVEKHPWRADLLETMHPKLGRYVPVGQAYYNDTLLSEKFRHNLLVARWDNRTVARYTLRQHGATFKAEENPLLIGRNDARPVSVAVGRGGRVFVTISFMAHNEGSPVYRSDLVMLTRADDNSNASFEAYEETQATPEKLVSELSNSSWSRRYRAHIELQRRGGQVLMEAANQLMTIKNDDPARAHLVWLAASSKTRLAGESLLNLSSSPNDADRFQATRALIEFQPPGASGGLFERLLDDANPQVRHAATLAFFQLTNRVPYAVVENAAASTDSYLRQAGTLLLAERASTNQLLSLLRATNNSLRLAGVLATGSRLTIPSATKPPAAHLPLDASRTNDYLVPFAEGVVDLRELGRIGNFAFADHWNEGPGTVEEEILFRALLAMLNDPVEQIRLQAAHYLYLLDDKRSEPLVAKVFAQTQEQALNNLPVKRVFELWLTGPFPDAAPGFATSHPVEQGPVDVAAEYTGAKGKVVWRKGKFASTESRGLIKLTEIFGEAERSSFYAHFRLDSPVAQSVLLLLGSDDGLKVWQNGKAVWENPAARAALPFQDSVRLQLQPGGNDILIRVQNIADASGLHVDCRISTNVSVVLPEKLSGPSLAERLKQGGGAVVPEEFMRLDWTQEVAKGNAERGRQLYQSLACANCHALRADAAGGGGPSLADAAKRFTVPYLVESILQPNKILSPVFRWTALVLKNGEELNGLAIGETSDKLELMLTTAARRTVNKAEIQSRKLQDKSPMPEGLVRTAEELRDLLAYVLKEAP